MIKWVERIGNIYHINNIRIMNKPNTDGFIEKDKELRDALEKLRKQYMKELKQKSLHVEQREALERMKNHWDGLLVFVDHPHIPMSNSEAEHMMRNPVLGRKNYYGSGAIWSAEYKAIMFRIFETLRKNGINEKKWLTKYFESCIECGGKVPSDISKFLSWNMSEKEKADYG